MDATLFQNYMSEEAFIVLLLIGIIANIIVRRKDNDTRKK